MKTLCETLAKPSETNARALANLFPATKRKKFDPLCHSANFNSQQKKKAFSSKGRSKLITVVCLDNDSHKVPRGSLRERLKGNGRIKDIPFFRYLTCEETKSSIEQAFSLSNGFTFLKSLKNILCVAEKQELNGAELISLAGKGSLYVTMKSIISTDTAHSADSVRIYLIPPSMTDSSLTSISSSHSQMSNAMKSDSFVSLSASGSNQSPSPHCSYTRSALMPKADDLLEKLQVIIYDY